MPHGWRFAARSAVSPNACGKTDARRELRDEITAAFVDRAPIDWAALLARVRDPRERASVRALAHLDRLRRSRAPMPAAERIPRAAALRVLVGLAVLQALCAVVGAVAVWVTAGGVAHVSAPLLLVLTFGTAGLMLASAAPRVGRSFFLMAAFMLAAAAFTRPVLSKLALTSDALSGPLFNGLFPEAFAPAALWRFAVLFPHVQRFTRFDVLARKAAAAAWVLASVLFLANVAAAYGLLPGAFAALAREDPRHVFWHAFVLTALPAVATILIRACRAPRTERSKASWFAAALAAGTAPFLLTALARMTIPAVGHWMRAGGTGRVLVDSLVLAALAAMPILATLAVLVDGRCELRRIVPAGLRATFWRCGFTSDPRDRSRTSRRRPHRERLAAALDRVRLARGSREIAAVLQRELQFGLGARSVRILDPAALPHGSALLHILEGCDTATDLSRDSEPFTLLPREEREWLDADGVTLAAAVRRRDGSVAAVVLLGGRTGEPVDAGSRWFVSTLVTGAAAAWDTPEVAITRRSQAGEVARECARCGTVVDAEARSPCCASEMVLAALPRRIAGNVVVVRRLGAGGMGVVYLGQDTALGRAVALKTLPEVRPGSIGRLRDEARAMAALNHPSLATIYGLELWRRTPVLVLEYFPGGTLAGRVAEGPLTVQDTVAIGVRLARALTYMHARGVLHRDVKPSNIGITAAGTVKLLDFGLAGGSTVRSGTPAYLPPEVLQGAPATAAVDLWGLAMVLREACGGRDRLPQELSAFFERALADSPGDRFRTAAHLRAGLQAIPAGIRSRR